MLRPGGKAFQRTLYRCQRKAKLKDRCKVNFVDKPLARQLDPPIQLTLKRCECGCGQPVAPGKRFAGRRCLALNAQKYRANRQVADEETAKQEVSSASGEAAKQAVSSAPEVAARNALDSAPEEAASIIPEEAAPMAQPGNGVLSLMKYSSGSTEPRADTLESVIEALRYLKALPRDVRKKTLELLEALEAAEA